MRWIRIGSMTRILARRRILIETLYAATAARFWLVQMLTVRAQDGFGSSLTCELLGTKIFEAFR